MNESLEETLRIESGRVLATLIRLTGDFQLAEDALQDAVVVALERWPDSGMPPNPGAWLTTTARNKALDRIRREANRSRKEAEAMHFLQDLPIEPPDGVDDRLRLFFTCCHPSVSREARVALTLRTVGGLTTNEIARAFLVPGPTMGQRISRAKQKIAVAKIPYRVPEDHELPDRLPSVLDALYVILTTGHHAAFDRLDSRVDLADEAIRLMRILGELMPGEDEVQGLLALALAAHARSPARLDTDGALVLLADQDRSVWDHEAIAEATDIVARRFRGPASGPYMLQAAIACAHGNAVGIEDTDWDGIATLYLMLEAETPTAVVRVNRAVAVAKADGPEAGLALLDDVNGVEEWHLWHSTRAGLFLLADRPDDAAVAYRDALACSMNESDREFLSARLAEVESASP